MHIQACLICDSASDYQGKLCVLGAFDRIVAPQMPAKHPHSAVVVRVRFERSEEGKHPFRLMMIDADGQAIGPKIEGEVNVAFAPGHESITMNLILGMNGLPLPRYGTYQFDFVLDGRQVATAPLYVVPPEQMRRAA